MKMSKNVDEKNNFPALVCMGPAKTSQRVSVKCFVHHVAMLVCRTKKPPEKF